jgi:hypothetical protein
MLCEVLVRESQYGDYHITDAGLAHLKRLPLKKLQLHYCGVTDAGLTHILRMPLHTLDLKHCRITDAGLTHISKLSLHTLDLTGCGITNDGVAQLAQMTSLRTLSLRSNYNLTGQLDLKSMSSFLEELDVMDCRLEDMYFQHCYGIRVKSGRTSLYYPSFTERIQCGYANMS